MAGVQDGVEAGHAVVAFGDAHALIAHSVFLAGGYGVAVMLSDDAVAAGAHGASGGAFAGVDGLQVGVDDFLLDFVDEGVVDEAHLVGQNFGDGLIHPPVCHRFEDRGVAEVQVRGEVDHRLGLAGGEGVHRDQMRHRHLTRIDHGEARARVGRVRGAVGMVQTLQHQLVRGDVSLRRRTVLCFPARAGGVGERGDRLLRTQLERRGRRGGWAGEESAGRGGRTRGRGRRGPGSIDCRPARRGSGGRIRGGGSRAWGGGGVVVVVKDVVVT